MSNLKIHDLPNEIIYIENAFPESKEFLLEIESNDTNSKIQSVIPNWEYWEDGYPVKTILEDGTISWEQVYGNKEEGHRGTVKYVDWDSSINQKNSIWPRVEVLPEYDEAHLESYKILKKIDLPYQEMLKIWSEKTGNNYPSTWVTKNYTIRKYKTGGQMGPHIDKNTENPNNTMEWTGLIYVNDDYEGGELVFDDLGLEIKPSAGSIIFFPCLEKHSVKPIISGTKTYIFTFIHLDVGIATCLGESYQELTRLIKDDKFALN